MDTNVLITERIAYAAIFTFFAYLMFLGIADSDGRTKNAFLWGLWMAVCSTFMLLNGLWLAKAVLAN